MEHSRMISRTFRTATPYDSVPRLNVRYFPPAVTAVFSARLFNVTDIVDRLSLEKSCYYPYIFEHILYSFGRGTLFSPICCLSCSLATYCHVFLAKRVV